MNIEDYREMLKELLKANKIDEFSRQGETLLHDHKRYGPHSGRNDHIFIWLEEAYESGLMSIQAEQLN